MIPKFNDPCVCCNEHEKQPFLQLFDDKCFRIIDKKDVKGCFCLKDLILPVDAHSCLELELDLNNGEITIFDNQVSLISSTELDSNKVYARGVIIKVDYPKKDIEGEEILFPEKSILIGLESSDTLNMTIYPIYNFFSIFTNPKSNSLTGLINKIKLINPNELFRVKINALVLFGKPQ